MATITLNELRRIKDSLPSGSIKRIADELNLTVETVRNYFGWTNYKEGTAVGVHIEQGPDGGIVVLDDETILNMAKYILTERNLLLYFLEAYSKKANEWLGERRGWLIEMHTAFKEFFKKENLENANWEYFQQLTDKKLIHAFNALPLAGKRALGNTNHPIEHYRKVFLYLRYGEDEDRVRFNNLLDKSSGYSLSYFGKSAISELIGQAFPEKYTFYNLRDVEAIKYLGLTIDEKNKSFGDFYIEYNDLILKNIAPQYNEIVKTKFDNEIPFGLRIDQFLSWVYETQIFDEMKESQTVSKPKGKLTKLKIKSFNQFKNFELDFTYPKGHKQEGKPLNKICFIGQSGTGKTTLLNIIKDLTSGNISELTDIANKDVELHYRLSDKAEIRKIEYIVELKNGSLTTKIPRIEKKHKVAKGDKISELETLIAVTAFPTLINFPPEIISQIKLFDEPIDTIELKSEYSFKEAVIDFSKNENNEIIQNIWENLLLKIKEYNEDVNKQKVKMANLILSNPNLQNEALKEFNEWKDFNFHPIELLARNYLNHFLDKFNLKINTNIADNKVFRFEPLNDTVEVKPELLSTGSKQIILRTLQFYSLWDSENETGLPRNSIILMDEPENSLYPDVQREIVDYYETLTENCQFFYATHSPIIASSFEPCERFVLKFDTKNGEINVQNGSAPKGTHSNAILKSEYETELLGEEGLLMWKRFLEIPNLISLETDKLKKMQLMDEYMTIGNTYNFINDEENIKK